MTPLAPPIAIIGMACRVPGADTPEQYWENLVREIESITRREHDGDGGFPPARERHVPSIGKVDGVEWFDADYFRVPPAEAVIMDPQHRVLLEVAADALADAGYAGPTDAVIGAFAGCGKNQYYTDYVAPKLMVEGQLADTRVVLANEKDLLVSRLAFKLGLTGPSVTVQTACSTSLTAVALACHSLAMGDCDIALAGGVTLALPETDGYRYTEGGILSADGRCRAFDRLASGAVPGSGAGIVVLKRDDAAQADGDNRRAVIRGWAINNDGGSRGGFTAPNVEGQSAVVRAAMDRAGVEPADVSYVEAHGTGTPIGDPVEIEALRRVFATNGDATGSCAVGSVKTNIGHTDAAAGVASLIKAAFAVETGTIPASLHFREANPEIDFGATPFFVNDATRAWPRESGPRIAGVSSFGLGGTNAHVVLENSPQVETAPPGRARQLVVLSARTDAELARAGANLAAWLNRHPSLSAGAFADVAYTLAVGRPAFASRWAGVFSAPADAAAAVRAEVAPAQLAARQTLAVRGTVDDLVRMAHDALEDPIIGAGFRDLALAAAADLDADAATWELDRLPAHQAGALAALACARALESVGLTFARFDGPAWFRPALEWFAQGRPLNELGVALAACVTDGTDAGGEAGAGCITIGLGFNLADAVAEAWSRGADVDWATYWAGEARRRVSLPTYPFTRKKFWLDRVEHGPVVGTTRSDGDRGQPAETDIEEALEAIWCEVLGLEHIAPDAHFVDDLDGDSLYAVTIGARVNERFGVDLPVDLPFLAPTLARSAGVIAEAMRLKVAS